MRRLIRSIATLFSFMFLMSAAACARVDWPEMKGKVVDAKTEQSIPGAIIVARWKGWGAYTTGICFHVESTTTDDQGVFEIPAWTNTGKYRGLKDQHVDITVYKPDYQLSPRQIEEQSHLKDTYYLELLKGAREDRLRKIAGIAVDCGSAGESKRNLLHLYRLIYENASILVATKDDKKIMSDLLFDIEAIELPYEEASEHNTDRLNAIDHE